MSASDMIDAVHEIYDRHVRKSAAWPRRVPQFPEYPGSQYFWSNEDMSRFVQKYNVRIAATVGGNEGFTATSPLANGGELIVFVPYSGVYLEVRLKDAFGISRTVQELLRLHVAKVARRHGAEFQFSVE